MKRSIHCAFDEEVRDGEKEVRDERGEDVWGESLEMSKGLPRYVRARPSSKKTTTAETIRRMLEIPKEENVKIRELRWLPGIFEIVPGTTPIARTEAYRKGDLYGIDAASAAAVRALDPQPGDHVLDICCAPGAKFSFICDTMHRTGSVTGVDVNHSRLASTRTMIKKYGLFDARSGAAWCCRLFDCDGKTFGYPPPGDCVDKDEDAFFDSRRFLLLEEKFKRRKRKNKSWRKREERARAASRRAPRMCPESYDRVIVDAECTHDGSVRHIAKFEDLATFKRVALNATRLAELRPLQRALLENGYRMLKRGGVLVYSTCSMMREQNEDVVAWLLKTYPGATVAPVSSDVSDWPAALGGLPHTIRFVPKRSNTSGLFIAKVVKGK